MCGSRLYPRRSPPASRCSGDDWLYWPIAVSTSSPIKRYPLEGSFQIFSISVCYMLDIVNASLEWCHLLSFPVANRG